MLDKKFLLYSLGSGLYFGTFFSLGFSFFWDFLNKAVPGYKPLLIFPPTNEFCFLFFGGMLAGPMFTICMRYINKSPKEQLKALLKDKELILQYFFFIFAITIMAFICFHHWYSKFFILDYLNRVLN